MLRIINRFAFIGFTAFLISCGGTNMSDGAGNQTSSSSSSSSSGDPGSSPIACGVQYEIKGDNTALIKLINLADIEIQGYELSWNQPGATVAAVWGASSFSQNGEGIVLVANSNDPDAAATLPADGPFTNGIALGIRYFNVKEPLSDQLEFRLNGTRCELQDAIPTGGAVFYKFYEAKLGSTQPSDLRPVCSSTTAFMNTAEVGYEGAGYFEFGTGGEQRLDIPEWYNHHSNLHPYATTIIRYSNGTNDTLRMTYTNKYQEEDTQKITTILEFPPTGSWSDWQEVAVTGRLGKFPATSLSSNDAVQLPLINSVTITWFQTCPGDCFMGPISIVSSQPNTCPTQARTILPL